ncbi:MAG TPA: 4-(cytidine 5'-diphospho)-2-C-methyl-D-erythritol kinase, partial [Aeromicrobium sp.]|nr:4-(cytidine 5'-diphospho)-2-C-methyl-D-erythritol kinase [Aeromicrobium sp.]
MTSATARVPAKINLSLGVGPVREDGFHQLATVYQALDVHDEVRATLVEDSGEIEVSVHLESSSTEFAEVPESKDNLAVRAALALQEAMGVEAGARLAIRKVIPVAGGMAGGS